MPRRRSFAFSLTLLVSIALTASARAQVPLESLTGLVVDDTEAALIGEWASSTHTAGYVGAGYQHDEKADKGKKSATYSFDIAEGGSYHVLVAYTPGGNRDKTVPVTVYAAGGAETVNLDQSKKPQLGTGFQSIGEFTFEVGSAKVVIETKGTKEHVILDAVRLLTPEEFATATKDEKETPKLVKNPNTPKIPVVKTPVAPEPKRPEFVKPAVDREVATLTSEQLDDMLENAVGHVKDAPLVDDAWFLRRVSLDLVGRQPTLEELRTFLDDTAPDKRERAVERLLANPEFGRNWANYWSDTIASRTPEPQLTFLNYDTFEEWLAGEFNQGTTWDEIVFQLMTPIGQVGEDPSGTFVGFHQGEPNRIAGETTRVFLGVKIACAQCHDHPFVDMPQEVFHGMAAFFVRTKVKLEWNDSDLISISSDPKAEHKMPGSKDMMKPTLLGGETHELGLSDLERRTKLGYWLVDGDNGHFARAYVNRVWARLVGRGFFDPVDDMGQSAEPMLAEVHDRVADHFVANGFDTRSVFRLIVNSRAYQRYLATENAADPFTVAITKKLRGDEVFDSLEAAIEIPNVTPPAEEASKDVRFPVPPKSTRDLVNVAFGYDPSFPDSWLSRTMTQAMFLMNNAQVQKQVDATPGSGTMLARLLESESDDAKVVDTLFERVLARRPESGEREIVLGHVERFEDRGEAFEDILWSLLNTAEFTTRK